MSDASAAHPTETISGQSTAELDAVWRGQLVWWHLGFAAVVILTGLGAWTNGVHGMRLLGAVLCLAVLVVAYVTIGAHGLAYRREGWQERVYAVVAGLCFLTMLAVAASDVVWLLAFVLFPQMWAALHLKEAAAFAVVTMAATGGILWWQSGRDESAMVGIVLSCGVSLALSMVLGVFVNLMVDEARDRAATIDELRATQSELAEAERAHGVYAERERLGREIHDTLAQGFTSVITLSRAAQAAAARGDYEELRRLLETIEAAGVDNLREARLLVAELSPGHLQSRTLPQALERLVGAAVGEGGLQGSLRVVGEPRSLATAAEVVLLRTAQEALANIRRHAGARAFVVGLRYGDDAVALTVSDDGVGFDPRMPRGGFGLDGIAARARRVQGLATVDSAVGEGTMLTVRVPG